MRWGAAMRGKDESSGSLFSYVDLEARVPRRSPLAGDPRSDERGAGGDVGRVRGALFAHGPSGDCAPGLRPGQAGDASAGAVASSVLLDPLGAPAYGAAGVQPSCSGGLWGWGSTTACGTRRCLRRTGSVFWRAMWRRAFLAHLVSLPAVKRLLSQDHFSVDGTQIEAWASIKSFRAVDEEPPEKDGDGDGAGGGRNAAATSMARAGRTRRTARPRMTIAASTARGRARKRSSATWAIALTRSLRTNRADRHDHVERRLQNPPLRPFFRSLLGKCRTSRQPRPAPPAGPAACTRPDSRHGSGT